ncbi:DUF1802 family protein [Paenibacillus sp. NPDC058071]|uniref:DUF1802 family protein n=1 Tax=Paenibacillus sp. NPDC058071 TaxID=3346326 RepID=UPI0036D7FDB4
MTDNTELQPAALKEWAVTVEALKEGELMMVMRKGGIAEETKEFRLVSPGFYLMPAYEHQKEHLLKEPFQGRIPGTMAEWKPDMASIKLDAYAEAVEDIEINDQETLEKLREFHIWTDGFAEERLKWKRTKPLHLLLLRVYKLAEPIEVPMQPAYTGCKSWVQLEEGQPRPQMIQSIPEDRLQRQIQAIKQAIGM